MNIFKRLCCILLSLFIICSCIALAEEAMSDEISNKEIIEESVAVETSTADEGKYKEAISALDAFGIIDAEVIKEGNKISRGDFVVAIMKMMGINSAADNSCDFSDVEDGDMAGMIKMAVQMNIVHGFPDGTFRPADTLKREQAVKMLVVALGYDTYAQSYGGYPGGYLVVASTQGLLKKNIVVGDYEECTYGAMAQLIFNTLHANVKEEVISGKKEFKDGNVAMTRWLGIYKAEGMVSANDITSIEDDRALGEGRVRIGEEIYVENGTGTDELLGYKIEFYYNMNFDDKVLLYAKTKNEPFETIIDAEDMSRGTLSEITYFDEADVKRLVADKKVIALYNGKCVKLDDSLFEISEGDIEVVDSDSNGRYDIVKIREYLTYVVESINTGTMTIADKYSQPVLKLDETYADGGLKIYSYDGEIEFAQIKKSNVIRITKSKDSSLVTAYVSTERVNGVVSEKTNDSLTIDGKVYKVVASNREEIMKVKIGERMIFYLDPDGHIAGSSDHILEGEYGYLIAAAPKESRESALASDVASFRIFKTDGNIETFDTAECITFNGEMINSAKKPYTGRIIVQTLTDGGRFTDQMIKYVLDENKNITAIYTAQDNTKEPFEAREDVFTLDFWFEYKNGRFVGPNKGGDSYNYGFLVYKDSYGGTLNNYLRVGGVPCIQIPELAASEKMIDREREITLFKPSNNWITPEPRVYNVKAFDLSENHVPGVILQKGEFKGNDTPPEQQFIYVDEVVNSVDKEGMPQKVVRGYRDGKLEEFPIDYTSEHKSVTGDLGISKGDVIRALRTAAGIKSFVKVFDYDSPASATDVLNGMVFNDICMELNGKTNSYYVPSTLTYWERFNIGLHCKIKRTDGASAIITFDNPKIEDKVAMIASGTNFMRYDVEKNTLSKATASDIDVYNDNLTYIVGIRYSVIYDIYIIDHGKPVDVKWGGIFAN